MTYPLIKIAGELVEDDFDYSDEQRELEEC